MSPTGALPGWVILLVAGVGLAGCREKTAPCERPPLGEITVFIEERSERDTWDFEAELVRAPTVTDLGYRKHVLRDPEGEERVLVFRGQGRLPIAEGIRYRFQVDTSPGMPTPCGVIITRDGGLVFAAASDYRPGRRVLRSGVPGFELSLEPADCGDRAENPCYASEVNGILAVSHAGAAARLHHGESATLGTYRVTCLTARFLEYSDRCADAGSFEIAYAIRPL